MSTYRLDQNHHAGSEHVRAIAGMARYVIASGEEHPWPVIERRTQGSAAYMTYRTMGMAREGLRRARNNSGLPELHIYDLEAQAP